MNFYKVVLIIICKNLEIYTKIISRLRVDDYKPILTSPSAKWISAFSIISFVNNDF